MLALKNMVSTSDGETGTETGWSACGAASGATSAPPLSETRVSSSATALMRIALLSTGRFRPWDPKSEAAVLEGSRGDEGRAQAGREREKNPVGELLLQSRHERGEWRAEIDDAMSLLPPRPLSGDTKDASFSFAPLTALAAGVDISG